MKKGILFITLISIFLLPPNLHAKKFFVKMAFGVASGGNIDDTLLTQTKYYPYILMGQEQESKLGQGIYFEFICQVNPHLSFSIGNGYANKILIRSF